MVWKDSVVNQNTLQRAIAQLRKVFGDDKTFIKTHVKKGYSLDATVRWENKAAESFQTRHFKPQEKIKQKQ